MNKGGLNYLGRHTTIAYLGESEWKQIPYLKDNNGLLPPFIIAVGDGRRVSKATEALKIKNPVKLHEVGERLIGLKGRGRSDMVVGKFEHNGKSIPILIVETQMGMPATEIITREVIAHTKTDYRYSSNTIQTNGIYIIRVGTAGGINNPEDDENEISLGDIANAEFSVGWSGTNIESMASLDYSSDKTISLFKEKWKEAGFDFTKDEKFPVAKSSKRLVEEIDKAAKTVGIRSIRGGNFSKDSLYAEEDKEAFLKLRTDYSIISTEMEQMAIAKVASDFAKININVHTGLVSGIIGVLPGESFSESEYENVKIAKVEEGSLKVAALALLNIV